MKISNLEKNESVKAKRAFCKVIAEKIKSARKQKGLTQEQLARKLHISQQVISRIEKGGENISLLTLKKIADGLGADIQIKIEFGFQDQSGDPRPKGRGPLLKAKSIPQIPFPELKTGDLAEGIRDQ